MNWAVASKWIIGVLGGLGIAWVIYAGVLKPVLFPNPSTDQNAESIINHYYSKPGVTFGCMSFRVYEREKIETGGIE